MRLFLLIVAFILAPPPLASAQVASTPQAVAVVIYPETFVEAEPPAGFPSQQWFESRGGYRGLALVTETRTVDLPAGPAVIRFENVADGIVPETVSLRGLPGGVVEQNYDFDLIAPGALVAHSVGRTVRLVRTDPATGEVSERPAVIRSGPAGVVLETEAGVEAIRCTGMTERIVFDQMPTGLTPRPTLSLQTVSTRAGRYTVMLSYLTTGLHWEAAYIMRVRPGTDRADLAAWITLTNDTSSRFADAQVQVVAGRVSRTSHTGSAMTRVPATNPNCEPPAVTGHGQALPIAVSAYTATEMMVATTRGLGDYHLYSLPNRTSVAAHQIKQVGMLNLRDVRFARVYVLDLSERWSLENPPPAILEARVLNTRGSGLGRPLPEGRVRWLEAAPDGSTVLIGEPPVSNTPVGTTLRMPLARATEVSVQAWEGDEAERDQCEGCHWWRTVYEVRNLKDVPIDFEFREVPDADRQVIHASAPYRLQEGAWVWRRRLQPRETFRLEVVRGRGDAAGLQQAVNVLRQSRR